MYCKITMTNASQIATERPDRSQREVEQGLDTTGRQSLAESAGPADVRSSDLYLDLRSERSLANDPRASESLRSSLDIQTLQQLREIENAISPEARFQLNEALNRDVFQENPEKIVEVIEDLHALIHNNPQLANDSLDGKNVEIVESTIEAIADYGSIHQGLSSNCTVTTFSIEACREKPWEYARIVSELSLQGETHLGDPSHGMRMEIYAGAIDQDNSRPDMGFHERSISNLIFQRSAMDFCHNVPVEGLVPGGNWQYNAELMRGELVGANGELVKTQAGLYPPQFQAFYQALFDKQVERIDCQNLTGSNSPTPSGAELLQMVSEQAQATGNGVPIEVKLGEFHEVMFEKIVTDSAGNEYVMIRNPWEAMGKVEVAGRTIGHDEHGRFEIYRREDFEQILLSAMLDKDTQGAAVDVYAVTSMEQRMNAPEQPEPFTDESGVEHIILHQGLGNIDSVPEHPSRNDQPILQSYLTEEVEKQPTGAIKLHQMTPQGEKQEIRWYTDSQRRYQLQSMWKDDDLFL